MKKIFYKKAKKFDELYDFFDDDTVEEIDNIDDSFEVVDYDNLYNSLQQGEKPVSEENLYDYLADEYIEEDEIIIDEEVDEVPFEAPYKEPDLDEGAPIEGNVFEGIKYAIDNKKVVKIEYATQGRRKRGIKLKREMRLHSGSLINRTVEPHYIFKARTTGNDIVVTWDRSVREIRAYIINNIKNYSFLDRKPFKIKDRILPKSNIGIKQMDSKRDSLKKINESLCSKGMEKTASIVKHFDKAIEEFKTAQYVGIQGYWIRNRRCWDNCYRHKRTTSPEKPAQIVWTECWDEYLKAIGDDNSGWEKYASSDGTILNKEYVKKWNKLFFEKVENKVKKEGLKRAEAIYATIEEESDVSYSNLLEQTSKMVDVCSDLKNKGFVKEAEEIQEIVDEVIKEAANPWQRAKKWVGDKWNDRGSANDIVENIQNTMDRAQEVITKGGKLSAIVIAVQQLIKYLTTYSDTKDPIAQQIIAQSVPLLNDFYTKVYNQFMTQRQRYLSNQKGQSTKKQNKKNNKSSESNSFFLKIIESQQGIPPYKQFIMQEIQSLMSNLSNIIMTSRQPQNQVEQQLQRQQQHPGQQQQQPQPGQQQQQQSTSPQQETEGQDDYIIRDLLHNIIDELTPTQLKGYKNQLRYREENRKRGRQE